jgi:hypothetical protein
MWESTFEGTVDRIDCGWAHITLTDETGQTFHASIEARIFTQKGIREGDDFSGKVEDEGEKCWVRFVKLPPRPLTTCEAAEIRREAAELRDE